MNTLYIGLGGVGSKIALQKGDNTNVICIDCDMNDLIKLRNEQQAKTITLAVNLLARNILAHIPYAAEYFPNDPRLLNGYYVDGSKQIREAGRLLYDYAKFQGTLRPLHQELDHLIRLQESNWKPIEIHIITTLAGGLGSGIYLQLAADIRKYLTHEYHDVKFTLKGTFLYSSNYSFVPFMCSRINMENNTRAALEELQAQSDLPPYDSYVLQDMLSDYIFSM